MTIVLSQAGYGKSDVRLVKVSRRPDGHDLRDLTIDVGLEGDFDAAYVDADNTGLVATDTMRNAVYALAKEHRSRTSSRSGSASSSTSSRPGGGVRRACTSSSIPGSGSSSADAPTSTPSSAGAAESASRPWSAPAAGWAGSKSKPGSTTSPC